MNEPQNVFNLIAVYMATSDFTIFILGGFNLDLYLSKRVTISSTLIIKSLVFD